MPVTSLITTPGAANSNAYVALSVADQYHLDRPAVGTTWASATSDQKTAAILWATKLLDRLFYWEGSVVDTTQILLWPRAGLVDVNDWSNLDTTTIPALIQYATAEFARQLLVEDLTGNVDLVRQGIKHLKAGSVAIDFFGTADVAPIPDAVINLIPQQWGYPRDNGGLAERELLRA